MKKCSRVLTVVSDILVQIGVRRLLRCDRLYDAGTVIDACRVLGTVECDLVLVDMTEPWGIWGHHIQRVKTKHPNVTILVRGPEQPTWCARAAWRAGADGYLPKTASEGELLLAIETLLEGRRYLHSATAEDMLKEDGPLVAGLTARDRALLYHLAHDRTDKEIASELRLAPPTVRADMSRLLRKLLLPDRTAAARFSIANGFQELDGAEAPAAADRKRILQTAFGPGAPRAKAEGSLEP